MQNHSVFRVAREITRVHGSGRVYGKIFEKLLAISFDPKRGGFRVENHSTEGVDIGLIKGAQKFAVEVKTTASGNTITLGDKDLREGVLRKADNEGYIPAIACFKIAVTEEWRIGDARFLTPGEYSPWTLSLRPIAELEAIANTWFPKTILDFKEQILGQGNGDTVLSILDQVLRAESQD